MNGWDEFMDWIQSVRVRMGDQWAPVALICLQVVESSDSIVDVKPWNDGAIVWPKAFPISERGPLLERLAKPYRDGTVLRS